MKPTYPLKLSILSISRRWLAKEEKYWFAGYHVLHVDFDGHEGWTFADIAHVGFGLESTHLKLMGLGKSLDPARRIVGFDLKFDVQRLRHHAWLVPDDKKRRDFEQKLVACIENHTNLCDQLGGPEADIYQIAAYRNDDFFKLNPAEEDEGWESPDGQNSRKVGRYLRARNAFLWFTLVQLTLNEQQISQALATYLDWICGKWPHGPLRERPLHVGR